MELCNWLDLAYLIGPDGGLDGQVGVNDFRGGLGPGIDGACAKVEVSQGSQRNCQDIYLKIFGIFDVFF